MRIAAFLLLLMGMMMDAPAATLHVAVDDPAATDDGPGSAERPYRSIRRALLSADAGDTVLIRPGTYWESSLSPRRSGTRQQPILIMAERPGTVVIAGGQRRSRPTRQEYPFIFSPPQRDPKNQEHWAGPRWITLRGLIFRDAVGSAVGAGTGWRIEDCLIDRANSSGIDARGDDIAILRTVVQDCGNNGMAGGFGRNIRVEDCILRRNNQFPDAPGGNAGASKFLYSQHMRVRRVISYDNFGPGWWMDWDNSDYLIEGCTIFANHAGHALENGQKLVDQPWAAAGIWSEGNSGHGEILNNVIFSNVAAGIGIFDSRDIIVRGNTIVDCGTGIEFRDLNRDGDVPEAQRTRNIENILVENNRIKAWRGDAAMLTSVGEFRRGQRPADYNVTIDRNVYDPAGAEARGFFRWIKVHAATLDETRGKLGIEANGRIEPFDFPFPLIATRSTDQAVLKSADPDRLRQVDSRQAEASGFDEALAAAREGQVVSLQVHGRTPGTTQGEAMSCDVYDLARKRHIAVTVGKDAWPAFAARVPEYAVLRPVPVRVRLVSLEPYRLSATLLEGDAQPSPADPR